jgi:hypothetical protein
MAMDIVPNTSDIDDESYQIRKSESEMRFIVLAECRAKQKY